MSSALTDCKSVLPLIASQVFLRLVIFGRREMEYAGTVLEVERDYKSRSALVEMKR